MWNELPCRPHREEPHRGLGPHPVRGRGGERVQIPQPHHHAEHAGGCRVAVWGDGGHPGGDSRRPHQGSQGLRHHQRGRFPRGARERWRHLHQGEQRDRGRLDQELHGTGGEFDAARPAACPDEGKAHNGADSHALSRARRYGRADPAHPGYAAGSGSRGRPGVQGGALGALRGTRYGLGHFLRGGAQAQGGQLPACRGVCGGRDETRADRPHRTGLPGHRRGDQEPHVR